MNEALESFVSFQSASRSAKGGGFYFTPPHHQWTQVEFLGGEVLSKSEGAPAPLSCVRHTEAKAETNVEVLEGKKHSWHSLVGDGGAT